MVVGRVKGKKKINSGATTPGFNANVELDNSALRVRNKTLTHDNAKLKQENGELQKQISNLRVEHLETLEKYINLKHVISAIDSSTKRCLPKLTEVMDTFTGIIQMCAETANLGNINKDPRTQAVNRKKKKEKKDPTKTLSRQKDSLSYSSPKASTSRIATNCVSPGTSQVVENRAEMEDESSDQEEDNGNDHENGDKENDDPEGDKTFVSRTRRVVTKNKMDICDIQEDVLRRKRTLPLLTIREEGESERFQEAGQQQQNTSNKAAGSGAPSPQTKVSTTTPTTSPANSTTGKPEPKPVECNLCHRKFKNIPALNGHMRLHGGYFKKASTSAIANFQTPSVSGNDCSSLNMSKSMALESQAAGRPKRSAQPKSYKEPNLVTSQAAGRPKRSAQPKSYKEPNLVTHATSDPILISSDSDGDSRDSGDSGDSEVEIVGLKMWRNQFIQ